MRRPLRTAVPLVVALLWLTGASVALAGQQPAPAVRSTPTDTQIEAFLVNARIERVRGLSKGVTNSQRATLTDGQITHDAHIQTIDVSKLEFQGTLHFRDSYQFNIAGYRLARLLGLSNVPPSVERRYNGKPAAFTWWIDDVLMDEGERKEKNATGPDPVRMGKQILVMRVFDALIFNTDRNAGNVQWTSDWTMWLIDHTRAFRRDKRLLLPQPLERCERTLFENMKRLTKAQLTETFGETVRDVEIEALLFRRDLIVRLFEELIARRGEAAVLYDLAN